MKYKDKHTHLLNYKFNKTTSGQNTVEIYRKKLIKQFSKEVLKSGFDPDWWSLVSRDEKYHLLLPMIFGLLSIIGVLLYRIRQREE